MINKYLLLGLLLCCSYLQLPLYAAIQTGKQAPSFKLNDIDGYTYELDSFKEKFIVLEWTNYDCPFVAKHYRSSHMQHLQNHYQSKNVIWLTINSSAKGKQGYFDKKTLKQKMKDYKTNPYAYLIDSDGKVGKLYEAKTTPYIVIINDKGLIAYHGAIDNDPGIWKSTPHQARNFVRIVLDAILKGKPAPISHVKSYGCSVKY